MERPLIILQRSDQELRRYKKRNGIRGFAGVIKSDVTVKKKKGPSPQREERTVQRGYGRIKGITP